MKRVFILGLVLIALTLTSCATITGASGEDNSAVYKEVIERHFNAILQVDIEAIQDTMDPMSDLYLSPEAIEQLKVVREALVIPGEVTVTEITVLEESATRALVRASLFLRADLYKTGEFNEQTSIQLVELTYKEGAWRIFDRTIEEQQE